VNLAKVCNPLVRKGVSSNLTDIKIAFFLAAVLLLACCWTALTSLIEALDARLGDEVSVAALEVALFFSSVC
jgi:hypothetical protein